jgi:hypothetical protein
MQQETEMTTDHDSEFDLVSFFGSAADDYAPMTSKLGQEARDAAIARYMAAEQVDYYGELFSSSVIYNNFSDIKLK